MPDSAACIASELGKIFCRLYCIQEMQRIVLPGSVAIAVTVQCLFKVCWLLTTFLSAEPPKCPSEQDKRGLGEWIKWYSALNASWRTHCIYRLACSVTMTIWVKYLCIVYGFCVLASDYKLHFECEVFLLLLFSYWAKFRGGDRRRSCTWHGTNNRGQSNFYLFRLSMLWRGKKAIALHQSRQTAYHLARSCYL